MSQPTDSSSKPQSPQSSGLGFFMVLMVLAAGLVGWYVVRPMLNGGGGDVVPATSAETLPDLHLVPLTAGSSQVTLPDTTGKVVLLNFWGTWCGPCRAEFPDIVALERKYRDNQGVLILPVSCGSSMREDIAQLRAETEAFLKKYDADMPNYADPGLATRKAVNEIVGFQGYPTTVLLDGEHRIRRTWVGQASQRELTSGIDALLSEK